MACWKLNSTRAMTSEPHSAVDGVHEDVKLVQAMERGGDDVGQGQHEAQRGEAAFAP